jgi:gas vesicle protein
MANKGVNFLVGFLTGVLTGAAIGLLLAPEPGEDTRNLIREKFDEYAEEGKKVFDEFKSKVKKDEE